MNRPPQTLLWMTFCAAGQLIFFTATAENSTNLPARAKLFSAPTNIEALMPRLDSPVDYFRRLLAMSPEERENYLTNRPPEVRKRILGKVREYEALDPNERELRLRATELRWYLMPLLRAPPADREAQLALVPEDIRRLVQSRLVEWEILPPPLQQEFLENERTLRYFAHIDPANTSPPEPDGRSGTSDAEQARWNSLSEQERQAITAQFNQFFEFTPVEKKEAFNTLSEAERMQMEKTLETFGKLPPQQRAECVRAFAKFASMSPPERAEFLKNAERWSQMSPSERKAWRDLVVNVPQWPPLPISLIMPPMPPQIQPVAHPLVATNLN